MTAPWLTPPMGALAAQALRLAQAIPTLDTPRLHLRAATLADYPAYETISFDGRWSSDAETPRDAWSDYCQMVAGWLLHGTGLYAIEDRQGTLLGFIPLCHEWGDPELELGWFLTPQAEGQGIAFEAAEAIRAHAAESLGLTTLVSDVDDGNTRSARVAERLGARRDPQAEAAVNHEARAYRHVMERRP